MITAYESPIYTKNTTTNTSRFSMLLLHLTSSNIFNIIAKRWRRVGVMLRSSIEIK